ncbi:MAG: glutamyl-tRNA reductase [Deltaproteobacteria bacterium]|nr:glutamyl-tRNA reductase [Deltaproteobacteria bacterium]
MNFMVVGLNHASAPIDIRERVHFGQNPGRALKELKTQTHIEEGVIVSTCNRVEIYTVSPVLAGSKPDPIFQFMARFHGLKEDQLEGHLYHYIAKDAVRHLFRVTSSLDSMVVGEAQILGQVKKAYEQSQEIGLAGPILHRTYQKAFSVAKRIRTETGLGRRQVSIASCAMELAKKIFDRLDEKVILVLGGGKMIHVLINELVDQGVRQFYLSNRSQIESPYFKFIPFHDFPVYLEKADMVFVCTSSPQFLVTHDLVGEAMRKRKYEPLFCVDLSVPRNVEPSIHAIENVYAYDIDDLKELAKKNFEMRQQEAKIADEIIEEEVQKFLNVLNHQMAAPTLKEIWDKVNHLRHQELEVLRQYLPRLSDEDFGYIEKFSERLAKQVLHDPIMTLRMEDDLKSSGLVQTLRKLFRLST